jgi:hypothetical protein
LSFSKAYDKLVAIISDLYKEHLYLLNSNKLDSFSKEIYYQVAQQKASQAVMVSGRHTKIKSEGII